METVLAHSVPAGFNQRLNAYGIDAVIIMAIGWFISLFVDDGGSLMGSLNPGDLHTFTNAVSALQSGTSSPALISDMKSLMLRMVIGSAGLGDITTYLPLLISAVYTIGFTASHWQATPGKRLCGIFVESATGERLTIIESAQRHLASGLSSISLGIGYLMVLFHPQKLAFHDLLCLTRVSRGKVVPSKQ